MALTLLFPKWYHTYAANIWKWTERSRMTRAMTDPTAIMLLKWGLPFSCIPLLSAMFLERWRKRATHSQAKLDSMEHPRGPHSLTTWLTPLSAARGRLNEALDAYRYSSNPKRPSKTSVLAPRQQPTQDRERQQYESTHSAARTPMSARNTTATKMGLARSFAKRERRIAWWQNLGEYPHTWRSDTSDNSLELKR